MTLTLVKGVLSAGLILLINFFAKQNPKLGGWIAALPIISLLSAFWLSVDKTTDDNVANFLIGVLWGYIPSALLVTVVIIGLKLNLGLLPGIAGGILVWAGSSWLINLVR